MIEFHCEKHWPAKVIHNEINCPICKEIKDLKFEIEDKSEDIAQLEEELIGALNALDIYSQKYEQRKED